jgi:hypothetical protein
MDWGSCPQLQPGGREDKTRRGQWVLMHLGGVVQVRAVSGSWLRLLCKDDLMLTIPSRLLSKITGQGVIVVKVYPADKHSLTPPAAGVEARLG